MPEAIATFTFERRHTEYHSQTIYFLTKSTLIRPTWASACIQNLFKASLYKEKGIFYLVHLDKRFIFTYCYKWEKLASKGHF